MGIIDYLKSKLGMNKPAPSTNPYNTPLANVLPRQDTSSPVYNLPGAPNQSKASPASPTSVRIGGGGGSRSSSSPQPQPTTTNVPLPPKPTAEQTNTNVAKTEAQLRNIQDQNQQLQQSVDPAVKARQEFNKIIADAIRQNRQAYDNSINPNTGRPYGVVDVAPSVGEQFKRSIKEGGYVKGTIGFAGSKAGRGIEKINTLVARKFNDPSAYKGEAEISDLANIAVTTGAYSGPGGSLLLIGSGAEDLITKSGRARIVSRAESLTKEFGVKPYLAVPLSATLSVAELTLGTRLIAPSVIGGVEKASKSVRAGATRFDKFISEFKTPPASEYGYIGKPTSRTDITQSNYLKNLPVKDLNYGLLGKPNPTQSQMLRDLRVSKDYGFIGKPEMSDVDYLMKLPEEGSGGLLGLPPKTDSRLPNNIKIDADYGFIGKPESTDASYLRDIRSDINYGLIGKPEAPRIEPTNYGFLGKTTPPKSSVQRLYGTPPTEGGLLGLPPETYRIRNMQRAVKNAAWELTGLPGTSQSPLEGYNILKRNIKNTFVPKINNFKNILDKGITATGKALYPERLNRAIMGMKEASVRSKTLLDTELSAARIKYGPSFDEPTLLDRYWKSVKSELARRRMLHDIASSDAYFSFTRELPKNEPFKADVFKGNMPSIVFSENPSSTQALVQELKLDELPTYVGGTAINTYSQYEYGYARALFGSIPEKGLLTLELPTRLDSSSFVGQILSPSPSTEVSATSPRLMSLSWTAPDIISNIIPRSRAKLDVRELPRLSEGTKQLPKIGFRDDIIEKGRGRTRQKLTQEYSQLKPPADFMVPKVLKVEKSPSKSYRRRIKIFGGEDTFTAFTKRKGKFIPVARGSDPTKVIKAGKNIVQNTLAASLRVLKNGKAIRLTPGKVFRTGKRDPFTIVQKAGGRKEPTVKGARLASFGERREIKASKLFKAPRPKRLKNPKYM